MRRGTYSLVDWFHFRCRYLFGRTYAYLRLWGVDLYTFLCCEPCSLMEKMPGRGTLDCCNFVMATGTLRKEAAIADIG